MVKNLPAMQETQVQSLGHEDPPGKGMAVHSSVLPWRIPWTEEPGATVHGVAKSWTRLSDQHFDFQKVLGNSMLPLKVSKFSMMNIYFFGNQNKLHTLKYQQ